MIAASSAHRGAREEMSGFILPATLIGASRPIPIAAIYSRRRASLDARHQRMAAAMSYRLLRPARRYAPMSIA